LFMNFDPVTELHSADYLGEPFETPQAPPAALGAHPELEDHGEHAVTRQAPLRSVGAMAHGREGGFDGVGSAQVNPVLGRKVVAARSLARHSTALGYFASKVAMN